MLLLNNIKQTILTIFVLYQVHSATPSCKDQVCESLDDVGVHTAANWKFIHFSSWIPVQRRYLGSNTFSDTNSHLTYITITRMVNGVSPLAFNGLLRLNTVVLQDNILSHLPKQLFQNNPMMKKIVIKNCQLEKIELGLFRNLPVLSHITIEGNRIQKIEKKMFPRSLVQLSLKRNRINYIEENTFHEMKKLERLDLSENKLHQFEIAKFMVHTPKLEELNLGSNSLETVSKLPTLSNLKYLYFDNNSISTIATKSFEECYNLEVLRLSLNRLLELKPEYFGENGLHTLSKLYISHNQIACIEDDVLRLFPKLEVAWFAMNPLNCSCYKGMMNYMTQHRVKTLYNYEEEWKNYRQCDKA